MEHKIPGIVAHHAIITPKCRKVQGTAYLALMEAYRRITDEYMACTAIEGNAGVSYHLVLTVERPDTVTVRILTKATP